MKKYRVRITDEAVLDLNAIHQYIEKELLNPSAADRIYGRLINGMASLKEMPERIKLMDSEPERQRGLRKMTIENYCIIFDIRGDVVNIINVFYGASDIESKLSK